MSIDVSIILPSLNVAPYVNKCIESVCNQTIYDIEILCIDAGSTDGTLQIIESYQKNDSRIRLINSEIKSYGAQVNLGIQMAKGKYIGIVETDDYVHPDMYRSLFELAEENRCDYIKADFDFFWEIDENKEILEKCSLFSSGSSEYNRVIDPSENDYIYTHDQNLWKGIYLKKFLLDNCIMLNESAGASYQDIGFAMQVFSFAKRAFYTDKSFYRYRCNRAESSCKSLKTFMFIWQELKFLQNNSNWSDSLNVWSICNRLSLSIIGEFRRLFVEFDASLENETIKPYLGLILDEYKKFMQQGIWPNVYTDNSVKEFVLQIINDADSFIKKERHIYIEQNARRFSLYESINDKRIQDIVIFGAGVYGKMCYRDLLHCGFYIVAVCDNNEKLWGMPFLPFYSTKIISPDELRQIFKNDILVIVANKNYSSEICMQLSEMKIPDSNIFRYM